MCMCACATAWSTDPTAYTLTPKRPGPSMYVSLALLHALLHGGRNKVKFVWCSSTAFVSLEPSTDQHQREGVATYTYMRNYGTNGSIWSNFYRYISFSRTCRKTAHHYTKKISTGIYLEWWCVGSENGQLSNYSIASVLCVGSDMV